MKKTSRIKANKTYLIITLALLLLGIFVYFSFIGTDEGSIARNESGSYGSEEAPLQLVVLIPSEAKHYTKEIKRVQDVLQIVLASWIDKKLLYIRTVPEPESESQRQHYFKVLAESDYKTVLLSPFEGPSSRKVRQESADKKFPHVFFSQDDMSVCQNGELSPFLWNLGITTSMYIEPYLTTLNQRYMKTASEVKYFFYVNEDERTVEQSRLYKKLIEELGSEFAGAVSVDDRYDDLYTTIRAIFGKVPDVLISFMTPRGRAAFFPQAAKLGLVLEMGMALDFGVEEEELISFGRDAEGIIVPVTYVSDYVSHQNDIFKEQLSRIADEQKPTMASYKGFIAAKLLDMIFSRSEILTSAKEKSVTHQEHAQNFSAAFEALDNSKILGPSGTILVHAAVHGLIQPLHIADFKGDHLKHFRYIGDVTKSSRNICLEDARD